MKRDELSVGRIVEDQYGGRLAVVSTKRWMTGSMYSRGSSAGLSLSGHPIRTNAVPSNDARVQGVLVIAERHVTGTALAELDEGQHLWADLKQPRQLFPVGTYAAMRAKEDAADAEVKAAKSAEREGQARDDAALLDSARAHWGHETLDNLLSLNGIAATKDGVLSDEDRRVLTAIVLCGQRRRDFHH